MCCFECGTNADGDVKRVFCALKFTKSYRGATYSVVRRKRSVCIALARSYIVDCANMRSIRTHVLVGDSESDAE